MGKAKSKKSPKKKELSEGKTIAIAVLFITAGLIGAIYIVRLVISFFFPGLLN